MTQILYFSFVFVILCGCRINEKTAEIASSDTPFYAEQHRPQLHFSQKEKWMNDPNGMVFHKGEYHLFYQYDPDGVVWGPMHWGHAVSKDIVHWDHLPVALYPDTLGLIFSGSAVVDQLNTSGFGTLENPPLVAIYTYHSQEKEKAGRIDYQYQGIAYSLDDGKTWTKHSGNPVVKNQGVKDFRDPKVFWHADTRKWIMILAVLDHVEIWGSENLKSWSKLSDFGLGYGAHDGVWECPDLFETWVEGETNRKWVMIVSTNPGGPNGGSGTQYFIGDFDGKDFISETPKEKTAWLDYGPDNYAGITWSNAPDNRKIFLGWMSNWAYAQEVPTSPWRSAMTLPRDLVLKKVNGEYYLKSQLSPEVHTLVRTEKTYTALLVRDLLLITNDASPKVTTSFISASLEAKDFAMVLSNNIGQKCMVGFDSKTQTYYIDRSQSGKTNFSKNFFAKSIAKRVSTEGTINFTAIVDVSSIELFFDDGITLMTAIFFPDENYTDLSLTSPTDLKVHTITLKELKSVWRK